MQALPVKMPAYRHKMKENRLSDNRTDSKLKYIHSYPSISDKVSFIFFVRHGSITIKVISSNTDTNTLITLFEQELNKTSTDLLDNTHSSQSGIFSFSTPDKHSYYGIQATAITKNMDILDFYAIKESTSSFTFLKEHLPFYLIVWLLVFIAILFLTRFLISKAIKPTEQTLRSQKEFIA